MKKKVLFVASLFLATATFAQDGLTSKKGEAYLPEAGDWAIGFDANPLLNYAGNMFNGNTDNFLGGNGKTDTTVGMWHHNNMVLHGKYFKDESTAFRVSLRIGFGSRSMTNLMDTSSAASNNVPAFIEDKKSSSHMMIALGFGLEKRKGNTRIQGYYGGELGIAFGSMSNTYDYGMAASGSSAGTGVIDFQYTDWDNYNEDDLTANGANLLQTGGSRTTEEKNGIYFCIKFKRFYRS